MLWQSTDDGQYATRSVFILQPRTPMEEEKLSWGVAQTVPASWAVAKGRNAREKRTESVGAERAAGRMVYGNE